MRTQISSQPSMVAQQQIGNPPMMSIPEKTLQAIYPYHQAASTGTDVLDINSLKLELDNAVPHW